MATQTATREPVGKLWLTPEEIAEQYEVSPITVRDWINVGVTTLVNPDGSRSRVKLAGKKVGGRWKVKPDALAAFIETATGPEWNLPSAHKETEAERKRRVEACMKRLAEKLGT